MSSAVEICNLALQLLGADSITALTENSKAARQCNLSYQPYRDSELRKYAWSFAIVRAQLAESTIPASFSDLFGYSSAYLLPSDCLRLLPPDPNEGTYMTEWKIEKGLILTNTGAPLQIRYIQKITDAAAFDVNFVEVLAAKLALVMCESLTQSSTKKAEMKDAYKEALAAARRANAFENIPMSQAPESWEANRI